MEVTALSLLLMSLLKICCNITNSLESLPYFLCFWCSYRQKANVLSSQYWLWTTIIKGLLATVTYTGCRIYLNLTVNSLLFSEYHCIWWQLKSHSDLDIVSAFCSLPRSREALQLCWKEQVKNLLYWIILRGWATWLKLHRVFPISEHAGQRIRAWS